VAKMQTDFYQGFSKSFKNFVKGIPVIIEYITNPNGVIIKNSHTNDEINYFFDFNLNVQENIYSIKLLIESWFPIMIEKKVSYKKLNGTELMDAYACPDMTNDTLIDDCLEYTDYKHYRIYKIIMGHKPNSFEPRDEVFIECLESNKKYRYSLNTPVSIFMKHIREKWDSEQTWLEFLKKSVLLNEIY
jgi:hypothetical protein